MAAWMLLLLILEGDLPFDTPVYWWEAPVDRRNGAWIQHTVNSTYTWVHNVRTADMDGNGTLDVVVAEQEQSPFRRVAVFYNGGTGNFTQQILSSGSGHSQVTGDTTRRGVLDILNAGHGYTGALHPLELYLNTHAPVR
jgi:FG-GAP-like repeat